MKQSRAATCAVPDRFIAMTHIRLLPASRATRTRTTTTASVLTALVAALSSAPAVAEGMYIGSSLGQTRFSGQGESDTTQGGKVFAGMQLAPGWSAELGFAPLGELSHADNGTVVRVKAHSLYLDAVGSWRVDEGVWLLGRVGVASSTVKASASTSTSSSGARASVSDTGLKYGVGASYTFSPRWAARAEWEQYALRVDGMSFKARALTVGLSYQF